MTDVTDHLCKSSPPVSDCAAHNAPAMPSEPCDCPEPTDSKFLNGGGGDDYPFTATDPAEPTPKIIASFNFLPGPVLIGSHSTWAVDQEEPLTIKLTFESPEALEKARAALANGPQGVMDVLDHELQIDFVKAQAKEAYDSVYKALNIYYQLVRICQMHVTEYLVPKADRRGRLATWLARRAFAKAQRLYPEAFDLNSRIISELDGKLWRHAEDARKAVRVFS